VGRVEKQPKTLENAESASWQGKIHRKIAFIWEKAVCPGRLRHASP
jgi:hypothetical protein